MKKPRRVPRTKSATQDDLQTQLNDIRLTIAWCVMQLDDQEPHPPDARKWRKVRRGLLAALEIGR